MTNSTRLNRCDLATGKITRLTDGRSRNSPGVWSRSADRLAYLSTPRNSTDVDLYQVRIAGPGTNHRLTRLEGAGWSVEDWSPDDRQIVLRELISTMGSHLWLFDTVTRKKTRITPKVTAEPVRYYGGLFSARGESLYVVTDRGSEFWRLGSIHLATKRHTILTSHIPWDVTAYTLSGDRKRIAFVTNEDGASVLRLLDPVTMKERRLPRLPVGTISSLQWHSNGRELGFTLETPHHPREVYTLDVDSGTIERWTDSGTAGIDPTSFTAPEVIHWRSFDRRIISGLLYRPPRSFEGRRPVIIDIHGGPESQSLSAFLGAYRFYLEGHGIALINPNIRGSSGYGKTFRALDNGLKRQDAIRDIGALLDWIRTQPDLDPERVMVMGASYGGYVTLAAAAMYSDRIRCAMAVSAPSNLRTLLERSSPHRQAFLRAEYGDERDPATRASLEKITPLNQAHRITRPLFIVHGANDPRVPLQEAEQMVAAVRKNGVPVWYFVAQNEGHSFLKPENNSLLFHFRVLFVVQFLLQ